MPVYQCDECGDVVDMGDAGEPELPCLDCGADVWVRIAEDAEDVDA